MEDHVIIPSPAGDYVQLAKNRGYSGEHWRKHILNLGTLIHPKTGEQMKLDGEFYENLVANFNRGVVDRVSMPLASDKNEHVEGPLANAGEVMGITREGNKVYVDLDVRDPAVQEGLRNRTILGASAFLHMNYCDTRTGQKVGPALLHSCVTNRPYVLGLDDYEQVVSATMADSDSEVVVLTPEEAVPTKEEMIAALKAEHGIDVEALVAAASQQTDLSALTAALTNAMGEQAPAGDETVSLSDVVQAVAQVSQANIALTAQVDELKLANAQAEVDGYIRVGRVMPKQRDAFVQLAMNDRPMMDQLLPTDPIVQMSEQSGTGGEPQGSDKQEYDIDQEVARLTKVMGEQSAVKSVRNGRGQQ